MIGRRLSRAALSGAVFASAKAKRLAIRLTRIVDLHPGWLTLTLYRRLSALRRPLAVKYPEENAGLFAVCVVE